MDAQSERAMWLAARHAKWSTPIELVSTALAHAGIDDFRRIVAGESNEVYEIVDRHGSRFVVRIAHRNARHFDAEVSVLARCREAGLPVPVVRHLEHVDTETERLSILVEDHLPGEPLTSLLRHTTAEKRRRLL